MKVINLLKNTAQVARVVDLEVGDVFKRIKERTEGYGGQPAIYFGLVQAIVQTEEAAAIQVIEFEDTYSYEQPKLNVFSTNEDIMIAPCEVEEFKVALSGLKDKLLKTIESAQRDIEQKQNILQSLDRMENIKPVTYREVAHVEA